MSLFSELAIAFVLGSATTLTSLCVLPLYPNFLFNLGERFKRDPGRETYFLFSTLVVAGVMTFMYSIGLLFTIVLQSSAVTVIEMVVPVIFGLLSVAGVLIILGFDVERYIPSWSIPRFENPLVNAYGFGLFFGAVVVPCSPVFIAIFLARSLLITSPLNTALNFLAFGVGIGFPLMLFSVLPVQKSRKIVQIFANRQKTLNRVGGAILVVVSLYYLIFVLEYSAFSL